jgi:ribosomal protein S12 methylthiotransferase accessory factor
MRSPGGGSYRQLRASAVHPNACMLFSDSQYEQRRAWNARGLSYARVADPLDEDLVIDWTPVWSLTAQEFRYLPTAYCYFGYPLATGAYHCLPDSNGNAAGNTLEEAILQGFFEVVERDGVCLWWYNRLRRPGVDLDSLDDPYVQKLRAHYRALERDIWVLDLTSDLAVPTFVAISRARGPSEKILVGFGAHFDPKIAIVRALTELNQFLVMVRTLENSGERSSDEPAVQEWLTTATLDNQPYLRPDATLPPRKYGSFEQTSIWSDDFREDVLRCQQMVEQRGLEMLVLDQTRPDIGLPVAKVIVPGMRHFWARFAPGRLYDVPVELGWLKTALSEQQLNPIPLFL